MNVYERVRQKDVRKKLFSKRKHTPVKTGKEIGNVLTKRGDFLVHL